METPSTTPDAQSPETPLPPETPPSSSPPPAPVPVQQPKAKRRFSVVLLVGLVLVGLVAGGLVGYAVSYSSLNSKVNSLQSLINSSSENATYLSYPNATYLLAGNVSLSQVYRQVQQSVVVIQDLLPGYNIFLQQVYSEQQGSGFIATVDNQQVIITNNHVVTGTINITVTFPDGDSYSAKEIGSDPLADLAVLTVNPMPSDLQSLTLVSSSTLSVGDPVVAVGSPYGLQGTLTTGVVSAMGRTITESSDSGQTGPTIPDIIQTSTAINPGNSGGPLLDYAGEVVGITTAAVSSSQGLGFAIPSDTIMREVSTIVSTGTYNNHPTIDANGIDMGYQISQQMNVNVTYGFLVESESTQNGLKGGNIAAYDDQGNQITIGGDIIIAINGTRITNTDSLLSYLEQNTLPGQTVNFTVVREGKTQMVPVTIGKLSQ